MDLVRFKEIMKIFCLHTKLPDLGFSNNYNMEKTAAAATIKHISSFFFLGLAIPFNLVEAFLSY